MDQHEIVYLAEKVRLAFAQDDRTHLLCLTVAVRQDRLYVSGVVDSAERRDVAEQVAREVVNGLVYVINEIQVEQYFAPTTSEPLE